MNWIQFENDFAIGRGFWILPPTIPDDGSLIVSLGEFRKACDHIVQGRESFGSIKEGKRHPEFPGLFVAYSALHKEKFGVAPPVPPSLAIELEVADDGTLPGK